MAMGEIAFRIQNRREGYEWHLDVHQVRRRQRRMLRHDEAQLHEDWNLLASRGQAAFFVRQASQHVQELHRRCRRRRVLCARPVPALPSRRGICKHRSLRRCRRDGKRQHRGQLHRARKMEAIARVSLQRNEYLRGRPSVFPYPRFRFADGRCSNQPRRAACRARPTEKSI